MKGGREHLAVSLVSTTSFPHLTRGGGLVSDWPASSRGLQVGSEGSASLELPQLYTKGFGWEGEGMCRSSDSALYKSCRIGSRTLLAQAFTWLTHYSGPAAQCLSVK